MYTMKQQDMGQQQMPGMKLMMYSMPVSFIFIFNGYSSGLNYYYFISGLIGIEYVPEAIADAKVNSAINGINNTLFYAGDMKDILTQEFINQHGRPDVIITDPCLLYTSRCV